LLARPLVLVVLALAPADAQSLRQRWPGLVDLEMGIQGSLVGPAFEQREPVGIHDALKDLELLTAGLLHDLKAARLVDFRQLSTFARGGGDAHDESYGHGGSLMRGERADMLPHCRAARGLRQLSKRDASPCDGL